MTDNLRDRIAAVLQPRLLSIMRFPDSSIATANANTMADAVIEALREERTCELCGRTGTQKYRETRTGWVCRSIPACDRRANDD